MPTFVLFKNGVKVKEVVGANPAGLHVRILSLSHSSCEISFIPITGAPQGRRLSIAARLSPTERLGLSVLYVFDIDIPKPLVTETCTTKIAIM
jgi:hypothetical protein